MVGAEALRTIDTRLLVAQSELPEEELRWCTVMLRDVQKHDFRLEASVFGIEGKHAREVLSQCKWPISSVCGNNGLSTSFYPTRFKRILVEHSEYPLILPSQIQEVNPEPKGYISPCCKTDFEMLKARKGQILITRSGTIGNCRLVAETLNGKTLSDDIIRIKCKEDNTGYLYAFLRTKVGNALIRSNEYGAVVSHIEPEHFENVPIPDPPALLKNRIHDLVIKSYALRDESNSLIDKAKLLLNEALKLPTLATLNPRYFGKADNQRSYEVNLSDLAGRLDASYHVPIVNSILHHLKNEAANITTICDSSISKRIILPGRFARVYVEEGQGVPFFGGKQLYELDPTNKKYLSLKHHKKRIRDQLTLEENMVMITCSGTIGKITLVPKHWEGWTANQHIIRVEPASDDIAGYLYIYLMSDYGRELIKRFIYGAVVDEINDRHVADVPVPILKDSSTQTEINRLALEANVKRTEAYNTEQEAIRIMNEEVVHATI